MERCSKDNKSERSLDQGSHLGCESGTGNACEQPGWSCRATMRLELLFPGLELDGHDSIFVHGCWPSKMATACAQTDIRMLTVNM